MSEEWNRRLAEAKERKFRLHKAEHKREELQQRLNEQERLAVKLEVQLDSERADVDRLERMSLANLFYTILGSREEQLELERQQALNAALKLQEARQSITDTKADLARVGEELVRFGNAEREYEELMAAKEDALRSRPSFSVELARMEERIADQRILVQEIQEALSAGKSLLASLLDASASLEKAENWGNWDTWGGGGLISTHLKHSHVDDAKRSIHNANHLLLSFRDELADLNRSLNMEIEIGGLLKLADYWFDGLIADWMVQGRIRNSQDRTLEAIHQVRTAVNQLQTELSAAESVLTGLLAKRSAWIEGTSLD